MDSVHYKAYAKINLGLDILGVSNGYHLLDSVVTTIDIFDEITIKKRKHDKLVNVYMHGLGSESIPPEKNTAVKAAERFVQAYSTCGVDVTIFKNIPMGAGLGGSSADVAGVLCAMQKLFDVQDEYGIKQIADGIGSDCGYMLYGGYARMQGRGEQVTLLDEDLKLNFVLLLPKTPVSTVECYKTYDALSVHVSPSAENLLSAIRERDLTKLGKGLTNALLPPAIKLNGEIAQAITDLNGFSPLGVSMTGSGSCVFALVENDQFAQYICSRYLGNCKIIMAKTHLPKRK